MEVFGFILFTLLIAGEALFFVRICKFPAHLTLLFAMLADTLLLYMFALTGLLAVGLYIVIAAAAAMGVLAVIHVLKNRSTGVTALPFAVFAGISVIVFIYTRGSALHLWDEFSHWGVIYRYLMIVQALPKDLNVITTAYPPASPLWQFFTSKIIGFSEANAYFAHMLIQFTAIIALVPLHKRTDWWKYALGFLALLLSAVALNFHFFALYVDQLVALLLGVGFAVSLAYDAYTTGDFLTGLACAVAAVLVKPTGILFALLIMLANVIALLTAKMRPSQSQGQSVLRIGHFLDYRIVLLLLLPAAAYLSWGQFSKNYDFNKISLQLDGTPVSFDNAFPSDTKQYLADLQRAEAEYRYTRGVLMQGDETTIGLVDIANMFTINAPYRTKLVAQNFISTFSNSPFPSTKLTVKMLLVGILLLAAINQLLLTNGSRRSQKLNLWVNGALLLGFIAYAAALYVSYVVIFYPLEATMVPSLSRYQGTYLLGWLLANLTMTYRVAIDVFERKHFAYAAWILAAVIAGYLFFIPTENYIHLPVTPIPVQLQTEAVYQRISQVGFRPSDKVFEVFSTLPAYQGFNHYVMRYLLTPTGSNNEGWLLEKANDDPNDRYSLDLEPEQWFDILTSQGYTYVLVTQSDEAFWKRYKSLVDRYSPNYGEAQLFRVTAGGLEYVLLN